mgnify:FL=1
MEEYKPCFDAVKAKLSAEGYDVISPIDLPHKHDKKWESYMKEDIAAMMHCDLVYALANWRSSNGAMIELFIAESLNIPIAYQQEASAEILDKHPLAMQIMQGIEARLHPLHAQEHLEVIDDVIDLLFEKYGAVLADEYINE